MSVEELRNSARIAYDRELAKQNLSVTMKSRLVVMYNGGCFTVNRELISFLNAYGSDTIYLLDDYDIPIEVVSDELLVLCKEKYKEIMNEWQLQYEEQSKIRTAKSL